MNRTRHYICLAICSVLLLSGCGAVNTQIKDIPIEQMDSLRDEYVGRKAWTRALLIDIAEGGVIDRDQEVEIVSLDLHWNGAVGVKGSNNKVIRHAMNISRPLTAEKYKDSLSRLFWFKKPDYRYRMNLRSFGKRTAKAIYNHELFRGMIREAALESWGFPDEMKQNDIGGVSSEQWIYKDPRERNKKRYVWIIDGEVDKWEE